MNEDFLRQRETGVTAGLKNFQRATVERIDQLFRQGRNRVLVADEVGLGKTLIARGCIAKTGVLRAEEGDNLFKVVYVCSNQNIARKNIIKLDVYNVGGFDRLSDSRLSMQHLRIVEQEIECENTGRDAQLIPLTPQTSFSMTWGGGTVGERALMFHILRRLPRLQGLEDGLERRMIYGGSKGWYGWAREHYAARVVDAERATADTDAPYPQTVISEIEEKYSDIIEDLATVIEEDRPIDGRLLNRLRTMFARISVKRLQPDLVIMDEFQRFKFLLSDDISDMGIIAHEFLNRSDTRVLLLSATPYKLYSTLEEIEDKPDEDHYQEFMQVMRFLFKDPAERSHFEKTWTQYSDTLRFLRQNDINVVLASKEAAENELYRGMCRTERLSVMNGEDFIDSESTRQPLNITPDDIRSYVEGCQLLEGIQGRNRRLPLDYAKSCPFLLSFMSNYKLMDSLNEYFKRNPDKLKGKKGLLWLNTERINNYQPLPQSNARLELLKEYLFVRSKSHMYLWVPPSLPYYDLRGVYKDSKHFSKILLFSAWEMVPKMIGSLISYEAERRTIGEVAKAAAKEDKRNTHYFLRKKGRRYPYSRLVGGSEWYLLYPSKWLASLYDPIASLNDHKSLSEICREVRGHVQAEIAKMQHMVTDESGRADNRWYLVAPMLVDGKEYIKPWLDCFNTIEGKIRVSEMLAEFKTSGIDFSKLNLGQQPDDLAEVLTQMSIGSPINCIYRSNGYNMQRAVALADVFINRFNTPEATAVVALAYSRKNDDSHWVDLLRYCADGCFQAMFDEYHHMLADEVQFLSDTDRETAIHNKMCGIDRDTGTLKMRTRSYAIDTPESLREKFINGSSRTNRTNMRSHFAVGFTKSKGTEGSDSKESIQDAFNSPLRPFVLASTSIGQEGLDFHYYCRKIMHWNLPGNPIDLEQREGRVNRFKCLAIRQNLAEYYAEAQFDTDVWSEIFDRATHDLLKTGASELTPFWCLGANQNIKIERIVPMYPLSRDQERYRRLIKILSLYRMTMGQARQEELLQYLLDSECDTSQLKSLFMNLSPFDHKTE